MSPNPMPIRLTSAFYTIILILTLTFSLTAQTKTGDEKVVINGKKYTLYRAVSGDSPFSIARKYGITPEELKSANPEIMEKLNSGQIVKIPLHESESQVKGQNGLQKDDKEDGLFSYHYVWKRETVFSIAKKHNVTIEDIYQYNPNSKEGIKEGDVLKIPKSGLSHEDSKPDATNIPQNQNTIKYSVGRKETLFSIAKKYNTTQEAILKLNPGHTGELVKGTVIIIPDVPSAPALVQQQVNDQETIAYRIVNGDNYFQLEKRFGIPKVELEKLNPSLKEGLNIGMTINIPVKKSGVTDTVETGKPEPLSNVPEKSQEKALYQSPSFTLLSSSKTYNVGLFLPFCQNLSDTFKIAQRTAGFLEFYSGVLLATEKAMEAGMKVKLFVYDTYQENNVIEKLIKKPEFLSFDLIIGPVYPENQKFVTELSAKNHIPMVSPLSSDNRFVSTTPDYYQINPLKNLRLSRTADYITEKFADQNLILLNNGSNSGDEKLIIERLNHIAGNSKIRRCNIWSEESGGLEKMLKTDKENVIILTEGQEANVSVAMNRLNTLAKTYEITLIGLQEYTKMQSIDVEYLHNLRLHYLAPYFIDYTNPKVITFVERYRNTFSSEPTQYSFQGYDIALHFLESLGKYGKNFSRSEQINGIELLQADYNFQKVSQLGGYLNQTLYMIEYTDRYEVKSLGKFLDTNIGKDK